MSSKATPQRWRENLEALTMAIVVALLFKYFILEISKIPSGSMQPTLMGSPRAGVFDRTVVDKLSFLLREPERFEIVVFKHPLEHSRIMVKRLVGMPGEQFKIEGGDLWTRADENEDWKILRKPPAVQEELWRTLDVRDPRQARWSVVRGGQSWRIAADEVQARGEGAMRFAADEGPITDEYLDGYPAALVDRVEPGNGGKNPVGDLRLRGRVLALAGTSRVTVELSEGRRVYEFRLPGPTADAAEATGAAPEVRIRDSADSSERIERGEPWHLEAGRRSSFSVENLDDRLCLEVDGRVLLAVEIERAAGQEASVTVAVEGEGADFSGLTLDRDLYYLAPENRAYWTATIPPGHYVMLGDNTQNSADSRLWFAREYRLGEGTGDGPALYRGNYREGGRWGEHQEPDQNPRYGQFPDGSLAVAFRDVWGETHWFADSAAVPDPPENAPLVPRELILGRAVAIFWPIHPWKGLWRLDWLH